MSLEQKTLVALKRRFELECMTSGSNAVLQTPMHLDDIKLLIINNVYNHPSTAYSLRNWLAREGYIIINEEKKIAIVNLEKLREVKE